MTDGDESRDTRQVWVPSRWRSGAHAKAYHTDKTCRYISDSHVKRTLCNLPDTITECDRCAGKPRKQGDHRRSLRDLITTGEIDISDESGDGVGGDA